MAGLDRTDNLGFLPTLRHRESPFGFCP
jgi:hypothetical protein